MKIAVVLLSLLFVVLINTQTVEVIQSSEAGDRFAPKPSFSFSNKLPPKPDVTITIDSTKRYQQILGFGGAFTESAAYVYSQLNAANQKKVIDSYFSAGGNGYSVCRTHINSCDFSLASYSFDDEVNDYPLTNFTIEHNMKWMVPFIKIAMQQTVRPIRLFATPWSPPAWMKSNGQMDGSNQPGLKASSQIYQSWALFFSKFISAYQAIGIPIWGITIQNEPEFAAPWEACCYNPEQERDFLKGYLGPLLRKDHPNLKIMIFDHNKDHVVNWVSTIFSDPVAAQYADGTAFHWYSGPQFENLAQAHNIAPTKFLLATEACNCPVSLNNWKNGESYGYDIIGDLNNWAVGWTDWNMLLDLQGGPNHLNNFCDAPIIADTKNQVLYFEPSFYYLGQISRYVLPNSYRIDTTLSGNGLSVVSVLTPEGNIVVVVMNQGAVTVTYELQIGNNYAPYQITAHTIQTLSFKP